jgi:hypothetical protein
MKRIFVVFYSCHVSLTILEEIFMNKKFYQMNDIELSEVIGGKKKKNYRYTNWFDRFFGIKTYIVH